MRAAPFPYPAQTYSFAGTQAPEPSVVSLHLRLDFETPAVQGQMALRLYKLYQHVARKYPARRAVHHAQDQCTVPARAWAKY